MKAYIFLKDGDEERLLAKVSNLEVIPRGLYVIDDEVYQYTGQPTFIINQPKQEPGSILVRGEETHYLERVEIMVEKYYPSIDL